MKVFGQPLSRAAIAGIVIALGIIFAVTLGPIVMSHGPNEIVGDTWKAPSSAYPLGLDNLGRDMMARMLDGGRTTLSLALAITLLSFLIGVTSGLAAATANGWVDAVLSRLVDLLMSLPQLVLALIVLSALGTSVPVLIGTIGVLEATRVFRVTRSVAMGIAALDFVHVARLRGEGLFWIMRREVLPSALPPIIAEFGLRFSFAFQFIAALSFLGLGVRPPNADWGSMVRENAQAIVYGGIAPLIPALGIALMTVGVNLVADWLISTHSPARGEEA